MHQQLEQREGDLQELREQVNSLRWAIEKMVEQQHAVAAIPTGNEEVKRKPSETDELKAEVRRLQLLIGQKSPGTTSQIQLAGGQGMKPQTAANLPPRATRKGVSTPTESISELPVEPTPHAGQDIVARPSKRAAVTRPIPVESSPARNEAPTIPQSNTEDLPSGKQGKTLGGLKLSSFFRK